MNAAVAPTSITYDALSEEFIMATSALCGSLASENPALLVDHMAKIFPSDDLLPLIDELGYALQKTPPRPAFFDALREELSASSGDSTATTDGLRLDEASQRAQESVRALTGAHYVDSSTFGIPRAEQDADGELLLGQCKECSATRLLSSLAEHEATCRPDRPASQELPGRQPSATASLPAASEDRPSVSQGGPAPNKRAHQKGSQGRPQKRPRAESAPAGGAAEALGSLPASSAPWAAQQPAKRLPPLYPGTGIGNAPQSVADAPVQHPVVPTSTVPSARPKPVVKLKQPLAAVKTSSVKTESPAAALNAAWANFPMPGDFMSEDLGSLPQGMDWLNSADLAAAPKSAPAQGAAGKPAAAKPAAKAGVKDAAAAAQKAAAKQAAAAKRAAAKKKRALANAPNRRLGLFQAFTHHPRKKRSASFKRKPRASFRNPAPQQSGAFAEVIASLAGDSPPKQQQQQRPVARPRQHQPAASQVSSGPRMRHPAAREYASLNALSAMPQLSTSYAPKQNRDTAHAPAEPGTAAHSRQPGHAGQSQQAPVEQPGQAGQPKGANAGQPGQMTLRQQLAKYNIPEAVFQKARAEGSAEPIRAYLRQRQVQQHHMQQQQAGSSSLQQTRIPQGQYPTSSGSSAGLLNGRGQTGQQQLPAPASGMIPISSQPQAHRLSGPHLRFGQPSSPQGGQCWGGHSYVQQPQVQQQQQHSAQQHEALNAKYVQRTGQPYQAANMPASQADSPRGRPAMQHLYSGVPISAQSNPMSTVTSSQSYRQPGPQQLGHPQNTPVSSPQYIQSGSSAMRASATKGQTGPVAAHAGQSGVSFGQQAGQPTAHARQPEVSFGQQQAISQPQRFFMNQQQLSGAAPQYYQHHSGLPAYLSNENGTLGLANGLNPLKGSRLGNLPQPEPSQAMRWIPTSITPPTDKLASVQQLNPIPGARPEDSVQPLMGQYNFQY